MFLSRIIHNQGKKNKMLVVESIAQYLWQWSRSPEMKIQTDGHGQSVALPLPQLSICKMKNNGIPLPPRNVINAVRLVKHLLFSDGEGKSIEHGVPCEKSFLLLRNSL